MSIVVFYLKCVCVCVCFHSYLFFRLHMVKWNVGTAEPPEDVSSLLKLHSPKTPDLYVIGWVSEQWLKAETYHSFRQSPLCQQLILLTINI